jgi:hypothetical protein
VSLINTGFILLNNFKNEFSLYKESLNFINTIIEADYCVKDAANLANTTSDNQVEKSKEASQKAIQLFIDAKEIGNQFLDNLKDYYGVNSNEYIEISQSLNVYLDYISLKINSQEEAIKADDSYISRNSEQIEESNSLSNNLEESAALLLSENIDIELSELMKKIILENRNTSEDINSWKYETLKISDNLDLVDKYLT